MEIKPEELRIRVIKAIKGTEDDSYEHGCDPDSRKERELEHDATYPGLVEAIRDIVGDKSIRPDEIRTFDPNWYCDTKGGETRVVTNNEANGRFRCMYDREENSRGRIPTLDESADFKSGKINLKSATYEIYFEVQLVGMDEDRLAGVLGVSRPG